MTFSSPEEAKEFVRLFGLSCKRYRECMLQKCDDCLTRQFREKGRVREEKKDE